MLPWRKIHGPVLAALAFVSLGGCGESESTRPAAAKPEHAPPVFRVKFDTSRGEFEVEVTRNWAPRGADRFYDLVNSHYYDGCRFFRVVPRFVAQFGLNGNPAVTRKWLPLTIPDDPVRENNVKGTLSFAKAGPASRTTQVFINLSDNVQLDRMGFAPFGKVVSGMESVGKLYKGYGDAPPHGVGPVQERIRNEGNEYLERYFPSLDYIKTATVVRTE